jgi:hypothetical protein
MTKLYLLGLIFFCGQAQADLEHIAGQGMVPGLQKLNISRGCFAKIATLGCGHPRDDHEFFITCLDDKRDKLSSNCLSFFNRLYGKKKLSELHEHSN